MLVAIEAVELRDPDQVAQRAGQERGQALARAGSAGVDERGEATEAVVERRHRDHRGDVWWRRTRLHRPIAALLAARGERADGERADEPTHARTV
jgi:hypothetical protein